MATGKHPKIGSVRKTSNGCEVARRVPRRDARCRQPSSNIAAIDFGTANCSLAYIIAGEMTDNGPNLLPLHGTVYRVPTAILFRNDGTVKAFGDTARKLYRNLDDEQRLEWAYFEQIKMDLQQDEVWEYVLCISNDHILAYTYTTGGEPRDESEGQE